MCFKVSSVEENERERENEIERKHEKSKVHFWKSHTKNWTKNFFLYSQRIRQSVPVRYWSLERFQCGFSQKPRVRPHGDSANLWCPIESSLASVQLETSRSRQAGKTFFSNCWLLRENVREPGALVDELEELFWMKLVLVFRNFQTWSAISINSIAFCALEFRLKPVSIQNPLVIEA